MYGCAMVVAESRRTGGTPGTEGVQEVSGETDGRSGRSEQLCHVQHSSTSAAVGSGARRHRDAGQ